MSYKPFNINSNVKVKLTDVGVHELEKQHNELLRFCPGLGKFEQPKLDEKGFYTVQMWVLMSSLGYMAEPGSELPFETEILIDLQQPKLDLH